MAELAGALRSVDLAPPSSFSLSLRTHEHRISSVKLPHHLSHPFFAGDGRSSVSRVSDPPCAPPSFLLSFSRAHSWRIGSASSQRAPDGDLTASKLIGGESRSVNDGPASALADAWVRLDRGSCLAAPLGTLHRVHLVVLGRWHFSIKENDFRN